MRRAKSAARFLRSTGVSPSTADPCTRDRSGRRNKKGGFADHPHGTTIGRLYNKHWVFEGVGGVYQRQCHGTFRLIVFAFTALAEASVQAEDAASPGGQLEEVVVMARKRSETMQN